MRGCPSIGQIAASLIYLLGSLCLGLQGRCVFGRDTDEGLRQCCLVIALRFW